MTRLQKLRHSLNSKMLFMCLLAMLAGMLVFIIVGLIGQLLVDNVYMSEENVKRRKSEIYSGFNSYVLETGISGKDTAAIAEWTAENEYATILLYGSGSRYKSFSRGRSFSTDARTGGELYAYGRLYPVRFSDGVYLIAITDSSQSREYLVAEIVAIAAAGICTIMLLLLYMNRMTRRIITLSRAAQEVSSGQLERSITASGCDEISSLARAMDEMRQSVIAQMGKEKQAWQANNELITAISHDIRTPMTSMIGYLGLLNDSDFSDIEHCRQFSRSAYSKAMDLKYLTDELFKYFLVFGSAELSLEMEMFDGRLLLEQLEGEAEFAITEAGFTVKRTGFEGECSVKADPLYLKRVMDNLVSNVLKYGDRGKNVLMLSRLKDGRLDFSLSNGVTRSLERVESTKIGLRTCQRIMEQMNGSFSVTQDAERFSASLSLPAEAAEAADAE